MKQVTPRTPSYRWRNRGSVGEAAPRRHSWVAGVGSRLLGSTPSPTAVHFLCPEPQCPLTPYLSGLNRLDRTSEQVYPRSYGGLGADNRAARGGKPRTTRRQEWSPKPHGPWCPVSLGLALLQTPVLCSGHCPSEGPRSPPSLQPVGDGYGDSWPKVEFFEGQGCHLEKWQRGLSTWLALLAQHPLAGWPAEAGVGPSARPAHLDTLRARRLSP